MIFAIMRLGYFWKRLHGQDHNGGELARRAAFLLLLGGALGAPAACSDSDTSTPKPWGTAGSSSDASVDASTEAAAEAASEAATEAASESGLDGEAEAGTGCVPKNCEQIGATCGSAPDGCGHKLECGSCPSGQQCGGGGVNKCGNTVCTPKSCLEVGAACGWASDQCGMALDCGGCAPPLACGAAGKPNECGCEPKTCGALGAACGTAPDTCGGSVECGTCPAGETCGGGGAANTCGTGSCVAKTCAEAGAACGVASDGCSKVISCGACPAGETCGGGGEANQCGCTPKSCEQLQADCGELDTGCGTVDCGTCAAGDTCGSGGTANQCGCVCALPHAVTTCKSGKCSLLVCHAGWGDCDAVEANGCEADVSADSSNCGQCSAVCALPNATSTCAASKCAVVACQAGFGDCNAQPDDGCETSLGTDIGNCGACGAGCVLANATSKCSSGSCAVTACNAGFADCNGAAADGCESDLKSDAKNCNACGNVCPSGTGTPVCVAGGCGFGCPLGWGDCDGQGGNGCETQLTSLTNCGACGNACTNPNGTTSCTGGACVPSCKNGYASCDGNPNNGCEAFLKSLQHCGACNVPCDFPNAAESCNNGTCQLGACSAGFANCDGSAANGCEASLSADPNNCGACGSVCSNANGTTACVSGVCVPACAAGHGDCDGNPKNGCESPLNTNANCGGCGTVCDLPNGSGSCASGTCVLAGCNAGFADCDSAASNGCEVNLQTSASNCGGCGQACSTNHATPGCSLGVCTVSCFAGWGNCDLDAKTNGCETSVYTTTNCGTCGTACTNAHGTTACPAGVCVPSCTAGYGNCDGNPSNGCEASLNSVANCGTCGTTCTNPNGTTTCPAGVCLPLCSTGYGNCDNNAANGCETQLATSVANCSACGKACSSVNGTPSCTNGTCAIACSPTWGNCNGNVTDGCETSLLSSASNCGACGKVCSTLFGTPSCFNGLCSSPCGVQAGKIIQAVNRQLALDQGAEASIDAPPGYVITGVGLRVSGDDVVTLRVRVQELLPEGALGGAVEVRAGTEPNGAIDANVDLPLCHVLVGLAARADGGIAKTLRLWAAPMSANGTLGAAVPFNGGSEPTGGLEAEYHAAAGRTVTAVGLRVTSDAVDGLRIATDLWQIQ
jgi:hypothetical protein